MNNKLTKLTTAFGLIFVLALLPFVTIAQQPLDRTPPKLPHFSATRGGGEEMQTPLDKLAPELRSLYEQFAPTRGESRGADESGVGGYTSNQLSEIFGISDTGKNLSVTVAVKFGSAAELEAVKKAGASIIFRAGNTVYAMTAVRDLARLANLANVESINVFKAMQIPSRPEENKLLELVPLSRGGEGGNTVKAPLANEFAKQNLTGKGVIIGVIDSGIDWRHEDFKKADGTSRILALWDLTDDSFQKTSGTIGSQPPVYFEKEKQWLGTVYTNEQINAALKGTGKVNSFDRYGHGTAVAGTAAGNGRATANGIAPGTYAGVAPEADLIVVKASDCDFFSPASVLTAEWIAEKAKELKKPVVINMSFGSQFGSHDGTTEGEQFIDWLTGAGKKGVIVAVAAGNDGRFSIHAADKFGAKRAGQIDTQSGIIELFVKEPSRMLGVFDSQDNWGLAFRSDNLLFADVNGKPATIFIYKAAGGLDYQASAELKNPELIKNFMASSNADFAANGAKTDTIHLQMPVGIYHWRAYGTTANVKNGKFDLYLVESPSLNKATFGMGTIKNAMVSSPGNAANAITVGSFDFRSSWTNIEGGETLFNSQTGTISDYSSPGFRRDGAVKPDISAPARFTISSLSQDSRIQNGGCQNSMANDSPTQFTRDGFHLAWEGTSAATPFAAGVIALMLEKNPTLDSAQVKQILYRTARKDGLVGAVPNPAWGWGMIDPAAALRATPIKAKMTPVKK